MATIFAINGPPFTLRLSRFDMRFPPIYSKRLLCFPIAKNTKEHHDYITNLLLEALRETVEKVPFLASSVVPSNEAKWLRDISPQGAAKLEVTDLSQEVNYADLQSANFVSSLLDAEKLCPFPAPFYGQGGPHDACRFRANFVNGGLILAVQLHHVIFDGRGISDVIEMFARNLRRKQAGVLSNSLDNDALKVSYFCDRSSLVSGFGTHGYIHENACFTTNLLPQPSLEGNKSIKNVCKNFQITKDSLQALKETCTSSSAETTTSGQPLRFSTHDTIGVLIWRSLMLARHRAGILSSTSNVTFATAVDCRRHLNLPKPYLGNAIYGIRFSLPISDFFSESSGLQKAATLFRSNINNVTADKFRDLIGFLERTDTQQLTRISVIEDIKKGTMMLLSYFGYEMYDLDFGEALGKMDAYRLPWNGVAPGLPVVYPRLLDGSCEFVMNEPENVMVFLNEDLTFRKYVSEG